LQLASWSADVGAALPAQRLVTAIQHFTATQCSSGTPGLVNALVPRCQGEISSPDEHLAMQSMST
jgi:hypothetical protein